MLLTREKIATKILIHITQLMYYKNAFINDLMAY